MNFLKTIWKRWLIIAKAIGNFQAQVILTAFYLVILLPLGVFFRLFADTLRMRTIKKSNFVKWEHPKETSEEARKQY